MHKGQCPGKLQQCEMGYTRKIPEGDKFGEKLRYFVNTIIYIFLVLSAEKDTTLIYVQYIQS